jgi:hypothetical protein
VIAGAVAIPGPDATVVAAERGAWYDNVRLRWRRLSPAKKEGVMISDIARSPILMTMLMSTRGS